MSSLDKTMEIKVSYTRIWYYHSVCEGKSLLAWQFIAL